MPRHSSPAVRHYAHVFMFMLKDYYLSREQWLLLGLHEIIQYSFGLFHVGLMSMQPPADHFTAFSLDLTVHS